MNVSPLPPNALEQLSSPGERVEAKGRVQRTEPATLEELIRANPDAAAAAREFESVFLRQLLGSVDKISSVGSGSKTQGEVVGSMMKGMLSDQMSAAGGIGLAEVILRALTDGLSQERPSPAVLTTASAEAAPEPAPEPK